MRYNSWPRPAAGSSRHSFEFEAARAARTAASIIASPSLGDLGEPFLGGRDW